jgi:hypothetical protein
VQALAIGCSRSTLDLRCPTRYQQKAKGASRNAFCRPLLANVAKNVDPRGARERQAAGSRDLAKPWKQSAEAQNAKHPMPSRSGAIQERTGARPNGASRHTQAERAMTGQELPFALAATPPLRYQQSQVAVAQTCCRPCDDLVALHDSNGEGVQEPHPTNCGKSHSRCAESRDHRAVESIYAR